MSHSGIVESGTFNLPIDHIDTDQIIPAEFLTTTERDGLGKFCFYSWRFDENGAERPDNPLRGFDAENQQVLVAAATSVAGLHASMLPGHCWTLVSKRSSAASLPISSAAIH